MTKRHAYKNAFRKWAEKRGYKVRNIVSGDECEACTGYVFQCGVLIPDFTDLYEVLCWDCTRSWHDSRPPQGWEMPFAEWLARRGARTRPRVEARRRRSAAMCLAIEKIAPMVPTLWSPEPGVRKLFAGGGRC